VTGHRDSSLPPGAAATVAERLERVLADVASAAAAIGAAHLDCFAEGPALLRMVSPLADGADQIAARAALAAGLDLQAVLPFERDEYAQDFTGDEGRAEFRELLGRASCVLELPGDRGHALNAYVMAGRATVAHCDLLIAVWDGQPARGKGGTGEVVEYALRRAVPVIHLPPEPDRAARVLWSGFDPLVTHTRLDEIPARAWSAELAHELLARLVAPPEDSAERAKLAHFLGERERLFRPRVEYPLLLAAAGAKGLHRGAWRVEAYEEATRREWQAFGEGGGSGAHGIRPSLGLLEAGYGWSDRLAQHFAQSYRSGHVFNFLVAGLVVVLALTVLLAPKLKVYISAGELLLISAVIANTHYGTRREWHRRWLDYRQLAERLRPMRSLAMLGLAQPGFAAEAAGAGRRRWFDWYAAAMWRAGGCPAGTVEAGRVETLARFVAEQELRPQIAYHRSSGSQIRHLDHRLHLIGTALFVATIANSAFFITSYFLFPEIVARHGNVFVFFSGSLPALGTAIFGIRVQGDFAGTADRSLATAERLEAIALELEKPGIGLSRAADLAEQAARTMLADLGEWRLAHQQRKLVIPA
jgi:hypothetical protein